MKKLFYIIIFIFFVFPISCFAAPITFERTSDNYLVPKDVEVDFNNLKDILRIPAVDAKQKIYDFSDELTEEEETAVYNRIRRYSDNTGVESVIVITSDIAGFPISDYSYHFYDYNDFKEEGIIFLIYLNEDNPEIFMGNSGFDESRVFKVYSDNRISEILKYVFSKDVVSKKYYEACLDYIEITENLYSKSFGNFKINSFGKVIANVPWFEVIVMSLAFSFIIVVIIFSRTTTNHRRKNISIKDYVNQTSMILKCEYDKPNNPK